MTVPSGICKHRTCCAPMLCGCGVCLLDHGCECNASTKWAACDTSDLEDYTPIPPKRTFTVKTRYTFVGKGKPMTIDIADDFGAIGSDDEQLAFGDAMYESHGCGDISETLFVVPMNKPVHMTILGYWWQSFLWVCAGMIIQLLMAKW